MSFAPPVDALNRGHATLWGNLGDWSQASDYVDAAGALALRLGEAAGLRPGQTVVDLGSGAGDQLRLWVEAFGVGHVTGVERDPELASQARRRLSEWGLDGRVSVVAGDAADAPWSDDSADCTLALDSAYFFQGRAAFLQRCRAVLRPNGVLAVTDLLLGEGHAARLARLVAPVFGVPRSNLMTEGEYREVMSSHGFGRIEMRDCTDDVLGGFSRWTEAGGHRRRGGLSPSARLGIGATGRLAGLLARSAGLRYAVVTAHRREA